MLILNLKNTGNVPVDVQHVVVNGVGDVDCRVAESGSPGTTFSIVCSGNILSGYDNSISGVVKDKVHRWKQHGADLQGRERTGGGNWDNN